MPIVVWYNNKAPFLLPNQRFKDVGLKKVNSVEKHAIYGLVLVLLPSLSYAPNESLIKH